MIDMSADISTMYTKNMNKTSGRRGYVLWKNEKVDRISPSSYSNYILQHKKRGKK